MSKNYFIVNWIKWSIKDGKQIKNQLWHAIITKQKQKNIIIKNVESVLINLPQTVNYRKNLMEKKLVYSNNSKIHTSYIQTFLFA